MRINDKYNIFIIGLGQIGGSLGYDLMRYRQVSDVIGYDISNSVSLIARKKGAISRVVRSIEKGIDQANLIILAIPICETIRMLPQICKLAGDDKIIIDVTTTKSKIFETLGKVKGSPNYYSCHPIAGTEKEGITSARRGLFVDSDFFVIPFKTAQKSSEATILEIGKYIGARPVFMNDTEHDQLIALTINVPYAIAVSLTSLAEKKAHANPELFKFLGGSFKSSTRVALSARELTLDMFLTNEKNICEMIDVFIAELQSVQKSIRNNETRLLSKMVDSAKSFRSGIDHG